MASDKDILIQKLYKVIDLLKSQKKEEDLTKEDEENLKIAINYFGGEYHFKNYSGFKEKLPQSEIDEYINTLKKKSDEIEKPEIKPKEQEASIPPELESLVAEYRQNQALLASEELKANAQLSVAQQVKMAMAHAKTREQVLLNRQSADKTQKFKDPDQVFVTYGSPKSESKTAALATSYAVVKQVAFSYKGFANLSPQLQNQIISSAVDLCTAGISDIDVALQASTKQIDISSLDNTKKNNLSSISGGYISTVFDELSASEKLIQENEDKIAANEEKILDLLKEKKDQEAQALEAENALLSAQIEDQANLLTKITERENEAFKKFTEDQGIRLSQDPDLKDKIENARNNIKSIHNNFVNNGIKSHIPSPTDDAYLLEKALRQDLPGNLKFYSGYNAERAAAIINHSKNNNDVLSPTSVLLYGKGLTPKLLAQARQFALSNPNSALGKLYSQRKDIFDATGSQIRKIAYSPLGKEISGFSSGYGKIIGKFSDKIPGGYGSIFQFASDPWGAIRSYAGKKAGEFFLKQFSKYVTDETLKKGAEFLLKDGLKAGIKKITEQVITKAVAREGAKAGIKIALESGAQAANVVPGLGVAIAIAIEIIFWLGDKIGQFFKKISQSLYGEEVKANELLLVPVAAVASTFFGRATTTIGTVTTFLAVLGTATIAAVSSAMVILITGIIIGAFFYITSIVTAPLISTLVQLQSQSLTTIPTSCANLPWPFDGTHYITQGPNVPVCTHHGSIAQSADFGLEIGNDIKSMTDGKVLFAGENESGYGNHVIIEAQTDDGQTFQIIYGHFSFVSVSTGSTVTTGQTIGLSGNTGFSTGPHLHLGYMGGVLYNSCPAGGFPINEGCCGGDTFECNQP